MSAWRKDPPGILCRRNKREITIVSPHMTMETIDEAAQTGQTCCGARWGLLPAHARDWIKSNEACPLYTSPTPRDQA